MHDPLPIQLSETNQNHFLEFSKYIAHALQHITLYVYMTKTSLAYFLFLLFTIVWNFHYIKTVYSEKKISLIS